MSIKRYKKMLTKQMIDSGSCYYLISGIMSMEVFHPEVTKMNVRCSDLATNLVSAISSGSPRFPEYVAKKHRVTTVKEVRGLLCCCCFLWCEQYFGLCQELCQHHYRAL